MRGLRLVDVEKRFGATVAVRRGSVEIDAGRIRFLPGAVEYAGQGALPGGLKNNREFASCVVETRRELAREIEDLLYDPQTSGGLLMSVPPGKLLMPPPKSAELPRKVLPSTVSVATFARRRMSYMTRASVKL